MKGVFKVRLLYSGIVDVVECVCDGRPGCVVGRIWIRKGECIPRYPEDRVRLGGRCAGHL